MENEDEDTTPGIDMFAKYNLEVGYRCILVEDSYGIHTECTLIENPSVIQNVNATSFSWDEAANNSGNSPTYGTIGFASKNYWYDYNTLSSTIDSNYESEGRTAPYVYGDYD